jgi:hypothetical protein
MEDFILNSDLKTLAKVYDVYGYMRNQIIDTLKKDKNFKMQYCSGSNFDFGYNDKEYSLNLNVAQNRYELNSNYETKRFHTLKEVLNAIKK